jgi:hypothetical protein
MIRKNVFQQQRRFLLMRNNVFQKRATIPIV